MKIKRCIIPKTSKWTFWFIYWRQAVKHECMGKNNQKDGNASQCINIL